MQRAAPSCTLRAVLLYLNQQTFVGEMGQKLMEDVRMARVSGVEIILVHENDSERGGCLFDRSLSFSFERFFLSLLRSLRLCVPPVHLWRRLFQTTPHDLVQDGMYKKLAVALHPNPFFAVSLALLAKSLGAARERSKAEKAVEYIFHSAARV